MASRFCEIGRDGNARLPSALTARWQPPTQGPAMILSSMSRLSILRARPSSVSPAAMIRPTYGSGHNSQPSAAVPLTHCFLKKAFLHVFTSAPSSPYVYWTNVRHEDADDPTYPQHEARKPRRAAKLKPSGKPYFFGLGCRPASRLSEGSCSAASGWRAAISAKGSISTTRSPRPMTWPTPTAPPSST